MEFVAKIVNILRGTESEVRSLGEFSGSSHPAAFPPGYPANLYWLGIHNKEVFSTIHPVGESLTDFFTQSGCLLPAVIELSAGNKIGYPGFVFLKFLLKEPFLAVYAFCFRCERQCHNL